MALDGSADGSPWSAYRAQIKTVALGSGITTVGNHAFYNCTNLSTVSLPATLTEIEGYAFGDCTGLREIPLPNGLVQIGDYAFYQCAKLEQITIPNSVRVVGSAAFASCSSLRSIQLSDKLTSLEFAFQGCTALTSVTIPDGVTSLSNAFENCTALNTVQLPAGLQSLGSASFRNCTGLEEIVIPDGTTEIGYEAFSGCANLRSISLPDSVQRVGTRAFANTACYNNAANWSDGLLRIGNWLIRADDSVVDCVIPDSVIGIASNAFEKCAKLKSVSIPDGVTILPSYTFYLCSALQAVELPSGLREIGVSAFDDVAETAWYAGDVQAVVEQGLMNGTGNFLFSPKRATNRAMIVTILYRQAGSPAVTGSNPFTDVADGQWYTNAIIWAEQNSIVNGFGNGVFKPLQSITREQMAAILRRYAKYLGHDVHETAALDSFPDVSSVSQWATEDLGWAVHAGLLTGNRIGDAVYLQPQGNATRCQTAALLNRFCAAFCSTET